MSAFPIPRLDQLPTRIEPCPIVEAILEIRFTTEEPWELLPGLLSTQIRKRYPKMLRLPAADIPDEIRRKDPHLIYQPYVQFLGSRFLIQFGPRVISLVCNQEYPGWTAVFEEMKWLFGALKVANFIAEGERLGLRYTDFFEGADLFEHLVIELRSDGNRVSGQDLTLTTTFEREGFAARLALANQALLSANGSGQRGSIFDLDLSLGATDFELFENGLDAFDRAHQINKQVFFGLLAPEFLAGLNPEYA